MQALSPANRFSRLRATGCRFRGFFAVTSSRWVDGPVPIVDFAHRFAKPGRELGGS